MTDRWTIERLVPGGEGLARLDDGRVGFASGTAPGDQIRVRVSRQKRGYVRAEAWELLDPGPDRVAPPCGLAGRCGGCDLMHLSPSAQLTAKRGMLVEALRRTGGIVTPPVAPELVAPGPELGYRNRARLHVEAMKLGFRARSSHELIPVCHCAVCSKAVNDALAHMARAPDSVLAELESVDFREDLAGGPTRLRLTPRHELASSTRAWLRDATRAFSIELPADPPREPQRFPLPGDLHLLVRGDSFTQVNWAVNAALVSALVAGARARTLSTFCELYCGAGNFTLPLLAAGLRGVAIEHNPDAIAAARQGAREARLPSDGFDSSDVGPAVRRLVRQQRRFDLVFLDPPRAGARAILDLVARLARRFIAICSCDPVTLARDVRHLNASGFELESVVGFDMFPQTHHLEALAWLQRREDGDPLASR